MSALLLALAITGVGIPTAEYVETINLAAGARQSAISPDPDAPLSSGSGHSPSPEPLFHAQTLPDEPAEDGSRLDRIIACESGGDPSAQNPVSSASGLYQFIDSTWAYTWTDYLGEQPPTPRAHLASVADQHRAGRALFDREGSTPWNASRGCWR